MATTCRTQLLLAHPHFLVRYGGGAASPKHNINWADGYLGCIEKPDVSYGSPYEYFCFLKSHFLSCNPTFASVVAQKTFEAPFGGILGIAIVEELNDPTFPPIAMCIVNRRPVYLFNDKYYIGLGFTCGHCAVQIDIDLKVCNRVDVDTVAMWELQAPDQEDIVA